MAGIPLHRRTYPRWWLICETQNGSRIVHSVGWYWTRWGASRARHRHERRRTSTMVRYVVVDSWRQR